MKSILKLNVILILLLFSTALSADTVEIVVFSVKAGVSDEGLLHTASQMQATIESWDGFISRDLVRIGNDKWVDIVHWRDMDSAISAQQKAMESDTCLNFFSLLDDSKQEIYHGELFLSH
jgi:heme-degrading monooxygenase HmoA